MAENFENEIIDTETLPVEELIVPEESEESSVQPEETSQQETSDEFKQETLRKYQRRLSNARQEKIRLQELASRLEQENEHLRSFSEKANEAASFHYDDSIKSRMRMAQNIKRQARENGDYDTEMSADVEITKLVSEQQEVNRYKAQQRMAEDNRNYQHSRQQSYEPVPELNLDTQDWLDRNSWANPQEEEYDEELFNAASAYAKSLEIKYRNNGQENKIMGKHYFDEIDRYMKDNFLNDTPSQSRRNYHRTSPISAVNRTKSNTGQKIRLTDMEKEFARNCGMTDAEYIEEKEKIMKKKR